jgi:outer membrane receptor protein involved in Fe transport
MKSFARGFLLAGAVATSLIVPIAAPAYAQTTARNYSIPAQDLGDALRQFGAQSGRDIVFDPALTAGKKSKPVAGAIDADRALQIMLEGSGLSYATTSTGFAVRSAVGNVAADADSASSQGEAAASPTDRAIVVTGTNIKGRAPIGAKLLVVSRKEINESGFATVPELLSKLPQNFNGGVTPTNQSDTSALNLNSGTAVNLRGLGADSTLVLVNGHRLPSGGLKGSFTDISSIPLSAIERVEILPDGASAIYGSDAVGGVVNFILRREFIGAESVAHAGTFDGSAGEYLGSQIIGTKIGSGNILLGVQYTYQKSLARSARSRTANDDFRRFGGTDFRSIFSNPGNILNPATFQPAFGIPAGQNGRSLTVAQLLPGVTNFHNSSEKGDLLPKQRMPSLFATWEQHPASWLSLAGDVRFSERKTELRNSGAAQVLAVPSSNPFFVDPFGGSSLIFLTYNFLSDLGPVTGRSKTDTLTVYQGLTAQLAPKWELTTGVSFGQERVRYRNTGQVNSAALAAALADPDPTTAFNPFGEGSNTNPATLADIAAVQTNSSRSRSWSGNVIAHGSLFDLPGGAVRLAIGADYRTEKVVTSQDVTGLVLPGTSTKREVTAGFAELAIPITSPSNRIPLVKDAQLSLAGRWERYSDFGSTFNPKLGANWAVNDDLRLRASWGKSFKAPRLADTIVIPGINAQAVILPIADPLSPTGISNALLRIGNNADLGPERARTLSAGIDFTPKWGDRLSLSITYFDVDYRDRIAAGGPAGNPFGVLFEEANWSSIITRNPSQALIDSICSSNEFIFGNCSIPPQVFVDLRLRNITKVSVKGFDFQASKPFDTRLGEFNAFINGTYFGSFKRSPSPTAPSVDFVNLTGEVRRLRARGGASWQLGNWSGTATVNYQSGFTDVLVNPHRHRPAYAPIDVTLAYRFNSNNALAGTEIRVTVVNLFNRKPPFANVQGYGYDTANADLLGRVSSIHLTKRW